MDCATTAGDSPGQPRTPAAPSDQAGAEWPAPAAASGIGPVGAALRAAGASRQPARGLLQASPASGAAGASGAQTEGGASGGQQFLVTTARALPTDGRPGGRPSVATAVTRRASWAARWIGAGLQVRRDLEGAPHAVPSPDDVVLLGEAQLAWLMSADGRRVLASLATGAAMPGTGPQLAQAETLELRR